MKKIILLLFTCLFLLNSYSQPLLIKKELSKIFFGVNLPITRFDVREKLNSNINLYNYKEISYPVTDFEDQIEVDFKNNPILSYTQSSINKSVSVPFKKGYDKSTMMSMSLWYKLSDISLSRNQFDEMIKIFKPISYKIVKENRYEDDDSNKKKIGEVVFIFSSPNSFNKFENCILILFDYFKEEHKIEPNHIFEIPNGEYIKLDLTLFSSRIY